jgi:hypothetical protein
LNFFRGLLKVLAKKAVIVSIRKYGTAAVFSEDIGNFHRKKNIVKQRKTQHGGKIALLPT